MARVKSEPVVLAEAVSGGRRDRTRTALLLAAEQLMASRPVDAVSIDEIVDAAGVAKGTFYNHFPDKESLQRDMLEVIRMDITKRIDSHNRDVPDVAHRVARAFCIVLRYALERPDRGNFLVRTSMAFKLVEGRMNSGLVQDISIGLINGRFRIATTENGALLMLGIIQAALVQTLENSQLFPTTARAQQLCAMMLRGLGLEFAESEIIAAQEADHIICGHEFSQAASAMGPVVAQAK